MTEHDLNHDCLAAVTPHWQPGPTKGIMTRMTTVTATEVVSDYSQCQSRLSVTGRSPPARPACQGSRAAVHVPHWHVNSLAELSDDPRLRIRVRHRVTVIQWPRPPSVRLIVSASQSLSCGGSDSDQAEVVTTDILVGSALLHLFIMLCSSIKNMNLSSRDYSCIA